MDWTIVKNRWVTWKALENMITNFPYRGTDARSRPATMREKKVFSNLFSGSLLEAV